MSPAEEWLLRMSEGLGLLWRTAPDRETEVKALDAFDEVRRLGMELAL